MRVKVPHKPIHVANAFLWKANQDGVCDIDKLKIQKLIYCLHGWTLATSGEPVVGELYQAWPYGPVLDSIYYATKRFPHDHITHFFDEFDPVDESRKAFMVGADDKGFWEVFDRVWDRYKCFSGLQLSALTHADGTPWSITRAKNETYIPNELIRDHFVSLAGGVVGA